MLTEFGKALRRIRLDNDELMKDMADKLKVSSAYLSAVENGKKKATSTLLRQIVDLYALSEEDAEVLNEAYQRSLNEVRMDTTNMTGNRQDLALIFARKISTIDEESIDEIMKILKK